VDKPAGPTSHDVVARVRKVFGTRAVGHCGTLDPFATGLLVLMIGRATRLARFVEAEAKTYLATARLGVATSTDDLTGEILPADAEPGDPGRAAVVAVLATLSGPQRQRPPAFSAKQVGGVRSYVRARRGETVMLPEAAVVIHDLEVVGYEFPNLQFRATVSPGTYVRALARDLGERLGMGAHLTALRREAIGALRVEQAVPLDRLEVGALLPPTQVLPHLPRVALSPTQAEAIGRGQSIPVDGWPPAAGAVAVTVAGRLMAVGRIAAGRFQPEVVLEAAG
jgi:tRNA pseudouridine55 synthase